MQILTAFLGSDVNQTVRPIPDVLGAKFSRREIMLVNAQGVPLDVETMLVERSIDDSRLTYSILYN